MAKKDTFAPEDVHQMVPIAEGDQTYGIAIVNLYDECMKIGMRGLFLQGASGLIMQEPKPASVEDIHRIISSQMFSRPQDQGTNVLDMKQSCGFHISALLDRTVLRESLRWFKTVRFQGDFEKLIDPEDYPNEGTGTMAVALAGNMALSGIVPRKKENCIIMREVKIASMHPDEEHDEPWLAVEFDMYVHNSCFSPIGLPRDVKTGYVPLSALKAAVEETD